jgi:hypothetical protein
MKAHRPPRTLRMTPMQLDPDNGVFSSVLRRFLRLPRASCTLTSIGKEAAGKSLSNSPPGTKPQKLFVDKQRLWIACQQTNVPVSTRFCRERMSLRDTTKDNVRVSMDSGSESIVTATSEVFLPIIKILFYCSETTPQTILTSSDYLSISLTIRLFC